MKTLYVGNLPYEMSTEELRSLFEAVGGVVNARVIIDNSTGFSRGFGFVDMADEQAAAAAMEQLNGVLAGGRTLVVNEARPRPWSRDSSYGYHG